MLLRKNNKPAYKEVAVPRESDMARNLQMQEEADRLEKERVKQLTLEINDRQEEEDFNESLAAVSSPIFHLNHSFRILFPHLLLVDAAPDVSKRESPAPPPAPAPKGSSRRRGCYFRRGTEAANPEVGPSPEGPPPRGEEDLNAPLRPPPPPSPLRRSNRV